MLVNRDRGQRKSHARMLREMGLEDILQAGDGNEAWSMVNQFEVGLIISTWSLGRDMSGLVLLKVVRADAVHTGIPFMLLAEEVTKEQVLEAAQAGVTDMLVMPFTPEAFQKKVEQALSEEEDAQTIQVRELMDQGMELMKQGQFDEALASFKSVLTVHESAEIYYNLGYIRTAQGRFEEAIAAFRKATQINQAFAQAFQKMGEVFAKMGRQDEARQCLERAAEIYMDRKEDEKAEKAYIKILEVNPNTPNVFNSLGIVYRRQGKCDDAIRMYIKALRVNPFDENIHYNLARSYLGVKKLNEAAQILKKALHINPDFTEGRNLLRSIELGLGLG